MNRVLSIGGTVALTASVLFAPAVSAQGMQMSPHPAHIHAGSCPEPGEVVASLGDVSFDMNVEGAPSAGAEPVGQPTAIPTEVSVTTVQLALTDIVAGQHAINVHASADDLGTYIACGDIGGTTVGEGDLAIGLGGLNDSGASGVAWLHDNGDGTTTVYVFIVPPAGAM
jgi:hypothetical protein